jgi:hypothetical protein
VICVLNFCVRGLPPIFRTPQQGVYCRSDVGVERSTRPGLCILLVAAHGGGVLVAFSTCSGLRLRPWLSVGDDGAGREGFFGSSPKRWWCGVLSCALFVCGGVNFGSGCTTVSSSFSYMAW